MFIRLSKRSDVEKKTGINSFSVKEIYSISKLNIGLSLKSALSKLFNCQNQQLRFHFKDSQISLKHPRKKRIDLSIKGLTVIFILILNILNEGEVSKDNWKLSEEIEPF